MTVIREVPLYDLRKVKSVEEAAVINEISDVAIVVYPKNGEAKLLAALRSIPTENIAFSAYLDGDDSIAVRNGVCELTDESFCDNDKNVYIVNGVCFIHDLKPETKGMVLINGILIIDEALKGKHNLAIPFVNGKTEYKNVKQMLSYDGQVVLSKQYLQYVKKNTLIVSANKIIIDEDVSIDDLAAAEIELLAVNKIKCSKKLIPYVMATAIYGNKVCEL